MKVLFVFDRPLYPVYGGAERRALSHLNYLESRHIEYDLFLIDRYNNYTQWDEDGFKLLSRHKVGRVFIHKVTEYSFDAFYRRFFSALSLLSTDFVDACSPIHALPRMIKAFNRVIANNNYDLIFFNHTYVSGALVKYSNIPCRTLIDTHDIYANLIKELIRLKREKKIDCSLKQDNIMKKFISFLYNRLSNLSFDYEKSLDREIRLLKKFDKILSISLEEMNILKTSNLIKNKVFLIPVVAEEKVIKPERQDSVFKILFIGSQYIPNVDAIKSFCEIVVPKINSRVELLIAGSVCLVEGIACHPQIKLLGLVDDLDQLYNSVDAVIIPLFYGSGVSIKAVEALSYGKPVISTPKGVRGLSVKNGQEVLIAQNLNEFPVLIKSLIDNVDLRKRLSKNAINYIAKEHSTFSVYHKLDQVILLP